MRKWHGNCIEECYLATSMVLTLIASATIPNDAVYSHGFRIGALNKQAHVRDIFNGIICSCMIGSSSLNQCTCMCAY